VVTAQSEHQTAILRYDEDGAHPAHRSTPMTRTMLALLLAVAALAVAACGGDDDAGEPGATTAPVTTAEPPAGGAAVPIAADPSGALKYETTTLTAKAGKVTFKFTNDASLGHDFVIERDGKKVAGTEVITESSTTLEAELQAGEYAFYCSVPGHRAAGMEGTLTVK
jgi:plastocyanin